MKYKILLLGNNKSIIDDMFMHLTDDLELQYSSNRFDDFACHLKYFRPHMVIYCMNNETQDTMQRLITVKFEKMPRTTPFAIIASQEDCDEFRRLSVNAANLELVKPITVNQILTKIQDYLERNFTFQEEPEPEPIMPTTKRPPEEQALMKELDSLFANTPSAAAPAAVPLVSADTPTPAPRIAQPSARRHILVVDDDFRMLKLIKRYLEDEYDIATAVNDKIALKFLQNRSTDLILLDYEMPEQNGPAVLEKLREYPLTANIPVIFLTGINDSKKIMQVLALKPQGYLLKPIDRDKLVEEIQKVLK